MGKDLTFVFLIEIKSQNSIKEMHQTSSVPGRSLYLLNLIIIVVVLSLSASITMAESTGEASSEAKVHIIYTEKPTDEEPKDYHLRTLSSALGRSVKKKKKNTIFLYFYEMGFDVLLSGMWSIVI